MNEKEYRSAYQDINPIRCVFEKAINSRVCNCSKSTRFNLADREGVSCNEHAAQALCKQTLRALRGNARFALRQKSIQGQLPHNAEIKIQNGGVQGIAKVLGCEQTGVQDIYALIAHAVQQYRSIDRLPYSEIMQQVAAYQSRQKRRREK